MATKKKMLQAAAGQAGGAALDITEVFSTYLYEGNGGYQVIENGINLESNTVIDADTSNTTASSIRSGSTLADFFATDGSYSVFGSASAGENLAVDYGSDTTVMNVTYKNIAGSDWAPTQVSVQSSPDNSTWTTQATYTDNATSNLQSINILGGASARYWRLHQDTATRNGGSGYEWHLGNFTMRGTTASAEAGEGGLVWIKDRDAGNGHNFYDTERGATKRLASNLTSAETTRTNGVTSFNANGFSGGNDASINTNGNDYASWTFRKAPKFFTCVTYTGDGVNGRTVSHNLGSVPGMIIVKSTSSALNWYVYHTDTGNGFDLFLNSKIAKNPADTWYYTDPTSTEFTLSSTRANNNGVEYVAYLFAHNDGDGEFGPDGDQDIIKCGSYTGTGGDFAQEITLGFEPQWVLIKRTDASSDWWLDDSMRGDKLLQPNDSQADIGADFVQPTATGFKPGYPNQSGQEYIYMAIRRGPLAPPESATEVFSVNTATQAINSSSPPPATGFVTDLGIYKNRSSGSSSWVWADRLRGAPYLSSNSTGAEATGANFTFDRMDGWSLTAGAWEASSSYGFWAWKRAPGFFDVVAYEWNGTATRNVEHNLGVPPEMYIVKRRNSTTGWYVRHKDFFGTNGSIVLNTTAATAQTGIFTTGGTTDTTFPVANDGTVNASGGTYVAYLFATLDGISKVGSYTGDGTTDGSKVIDCGFTSGARFVLIKSADAIGNWNVFDTARGIIVGNDALLRLNSTTAEVSTDQIDPHPSGFKMSSGSSTIVNISGVSYIFYAIA